MNTSVNKARAAAVSFDEDNLWVDLVDGRRLSVPLSFFPRLLHATEAQRNNVIISGGGLGLHWEDIDEDISVAEQCLPYSRHPHERDSGPGGFV